MPILKIQTNAAIEDQKALMSDATDFLSGLLNKPRDYIMILLEPGNMLFAGESDPTAYIELKSIGFPVDNTKEVSEKLCDFIYGWLHVPQDRIYIEFTDSERNMLGWNGKTFGG